MSPRLRVPSRLTAEQRALVEAHLDYAKRGALRYRRVFGQAWETSLDEFVSAAYFGLVYAATKYDGRPGVTFRTYAFQWIDRELRRVGQQRLRARGWMWNPSRDDLAAGKSGMQPALPRCEWPTNGDGDPIEFADASRNIDAEIERAQLIALVLDSARNERERAILQGRLEGQTMQEIGASLGVSRGLVWMLERPILERARAYVQDRLQARTTL